MSETNLEDAGDWLLKLKTSPPPSHLWHVLRTDALNKLRNSQTLKLALVHAPAGYGKTTFLSQAYRNTVHDDITAIWMTLDESDETPAGFIANLKAAVDLALMAGDEPKPSQAAKVSLTLKAKMDAILTQLARLDRRIFIFFDEGDHLKGRELIQAFSYLIDKAPPKLTFVIASRGVLPLKTAEYRADYQLCQITTMDLRFNNREIAAFLQDVLPENFPLDFVIQTEGWPLALQMVKLWLQEHPSRLHRARDIPINLMDIANYLAEQIFADLSLDLQNFLAMTSILNRFTGDVANAVCLRSDGWTLIEQLVKSNCFIIPLDSEGQWYRYHPLFIAFLQNCLRLRHHIRVAELHARASEWFFSTRQWALAVRHALASEDYERTADIIEQAGGWKLVPTSSAPVVEQALTLMPDNLIRRRPRLSLAKAFLLAKHGQIKAALAYAEKPFSEETDQPENLPETIEKQVVLLLLNGFSDGYLMPAHREQILSTSRHIELSDDVTRASFYNCLCLYNMDFRNFDLAEQQGITTVDLLQAANMEGAAEYIYCQLAQINIARGDFEQATHYLTIVMGDHQQEWLFESNTSKFAAIYAAEIAYAQNRIEEAEKLLGRAFLYITKIDGWFDLLASGFATAVKLALHKSEFNTAFAILDSADAIATERNLIRLKGFTAAWRLIIACRDDTEDISPYFERLQRLTAEQETFPDWHITWRLAEVIAFAEGQYFLRLHNHQMANQRLEPYYEEAGQKNLRHQRLWTSHLLAHSTLGQGNERRARALMAEALTLGAEMGAVRPFLDYDWPATARLIRETVKRNGCLSQRVTAFTKGLLELDSALEANPTENLTDREAEVLELVAAGYATKEIAFELKLSENTIKYYRKKIHSKLGVSSRSRVVAVARQTAPLKRP